MLHHGGNLTAAAQRYGVHIDKWLDLSTGISPWSWPVPTIPEQIWQRLPENDDSLEHAARNYYQTNSLLAVPGSQFAIQTLPALFAASKVLMPARGYAEHQAAWAKAGHTIILYHDHEIDDLEEKISHNNIDILLVINPNNPTTKIINPQQLRNLHQLLQNKGGYLIVDEAFMDITPEHSLAKYCPSSSLIVLRSLGKFFGLAGIRLGFVLAEQSLLEPLIHMLGPWAVTAPTRWVGAMALQDELWQQSQRPRLITSANKLATYLHNKLSKINYSLAHTGLFITVDVAANYGDLIYEHLAMHGVLIRYFKLNNQQVSLRFGLLKNDLEWNHFDKAMSEINFDNN